MDKLYIKPGEYEQKMQEAQQITNDISNGNIQLSDLVGKGKKGNQIIKNLQNTLNHFGKTIAKVETDDNKEVPYNRDKGGKDIKNDVSLNQSDNQNQTNQSRPTQQPNQQNTQQGNLFNN